MKRVKDILAHTAVNSRSQRSSIQQFPISGLSNAVGNFDATTSSSGNILTNVLGGAPAGVAEQVASLSKQLNDLRAVQQTHIDITNQNTQALTQSTGARTSSGSNSNTAGSLISSIFGSTFGLSPLVKGLFSLFGGGGTTQTIQPLVPFTLPPSVQYEGAYSPANGAQIAPLDYGQNGAARITAPPPSTNVQIQVNAMDSRSFLDHSDDIARAVREAILNSSSLNDVIADL